MPPTRHKTCMMGPSFLHRAARDLVGRLTRQRARFAAIPKVWRVLGHPRALDVTRRASCEHPPRARAAAHQAQAGAGRCFRRSGGVPEGLKLVPARAMMLTGRPQSGSGARARAMMDEAGRVRARTHAHDAGQGGKGRRDQGKGEEEGGGGAPPAQ